VRRGPRRHHLIQPIQLASDAGNATGLVFFLFDLLHLDGEDLMARPLIDRKARLAALLASVPSPLQYRDHQIGHGREFHKQACAMAFEGIVSKRADAPSAPRSLSPPVFTSCGARPCTAAVEPKPARHPRDVAAAVSRVHRIAAPSTFLQGSCLAAAKVFLAGPKGEDGSVAANFMYVEKDGIKPPM
jgi:hypothetical protein